MNFLCTLSLALTMPLMQSMAESTTYDDYQKRNYDRVEMPNFWLSNFPVIGGTGYLALLGNNAISGFDILATYSLNSSTGALVNEQTVSAVTGETFGLISGVTIDITSSTAFISVKGFDTIQSCYFITTYSIDNTTNALVNKQKLYALFTESITVIDWVDVNNTGYIASWGIDSTKHAPYIAIFTLDPSTGALFNKQKIILNSLQTIGQTQWVVVDNVAYLAVWGFDGQRQLYYVSIYSLDEATGALLFSQQILSAQLETITQFCWTVVSSTAYLHIRGFDGNSQSPYITTFTLSSEGILSNKKKLVVPQRNFIKYMASITAHGIGYLATMGKNFLQNTATITIYNIDPTTGALANKQEILKNRFESITFIALVVVDETAYLANRGFDNLANTFYETIYTLDSTTGKLINPKKVLARPFETVTDMAWILVNNVAYLGIRGLDTLTHSLYEIIYTLDPTLGALVNRQKTIENQLTTCVQMEWLAV